MTELMQGRSLDTLDDFETPTFDMSIVSDSFNLESHFVDSNAKLGFAFLSSKKSFEFSEWKYDAKMDELEFLTDIAKKMGVARCTLYDWKNKFPAAPPGNQCRARNPPPSPCTLRKRKSLPLSLSRFPERSFRFPLCAEPKDNPPEK